MGEYLLKEYLAIYIYKIGKILFTEEDVNSHPK